MGDLRKGDEEPSATAGLSRVRMDGRRLHAQRTSTAIVEATRRLMWAGHFQPRASDVAASARVSSRSIFQRYHSMESLYVVALEDAELVRAIATHLLGPELPEILAERMVRLLIGGIPKELRGQRLKPRPD